VFVLKLFQLNFKKRNNNIYNMSIKVIKQEIERYSMDKQIRHILLFKLQLLEGHLREYSLK